MRSWSDRPWRAFDVESTPLSGGGLQWSTQQWVVVVDLERERDEIYRTREAVERG
jgi:hypothetical protein